MEIVGILSEDFSFQDINSCFKNVSVLVANQVVCYYGFF